MVTGLTDYLDTLQSLIQSEVFLNNSLPLLGDQLQQVDKFIDDLEKVDQAVTTLQEAVDEIQALGAAATSENIKTILFDALGANGLDLLQNLDTNNQITKEDILITNSNEIKIRLNFGDSESYDIPFADSLGLPGLQLSIDGNAKVDLTFDASFTFGFHKDNGFFLDTSAQDELSIGVEASLPNSAATGKLGFLQLDVTDKESKLKTAFAVDLDDANQDTLQQAESKGLSIFTDVQTLPGGGLSFPLFDSPTQAFNLLLGQDVDLLNFQLPGFGAGFNFGDKIPLPTPLPVPIFVNYDFDANFTSPGLTFGYDTTGIKNGDPFQGFFVDGSKPIFEVDAEISGGVSAGVPKIAEAGGKAFIKGEVDFYLPGRQEKARIQDLVNSFSSSNFFDSDGSVTAGASIWAEHITFNPIKGFLGILTGDFEKLVDRHEKNLVTFDIFDFSANSSDPPEPPNLATLLTNGELRLNMGSFASERNINQDIEDENFGVTSNVVVSAFGEEETYANVSKIIAFADTGNDVISIEADVVAELHGGLGEDSLYGGSQNDLLFGDEGADRLVGGDGNDQLYGGEDSDRLYGDQGNDSLEGEAGNDFLDGGFGDDQLFGGEDNDELYGRSGQDILDGGSGNDTLFGNDGNDELYGKNGDDLLVAGEGNDTLFGGEGNDLLGGEAGDDILSGDIGSDILSGGEGDDQLFGEQGDDILHGEAGNDQLVGGTGNDELAGGTDADHLNGNAGDDSLMGEAGNDFLMGETGNDLIDGGTEVDTVSYDNSTSGVIVNIDETQNYQNPDVANSSHIEPHFTINAGTAKDGFGTTDTLRNLENIIGSEFNDILIGNNQNNRIEASTGNDLLIGNAGDDYLDGGDNIDTVSYRHDSGSVYVNLDETQSYQNPGGYLHTTIVSDSLIPTDTQPNFTLNAGTALDGFGNTDELRNLENLVGSGYDDVLIGNDSDNQIEGLAGNDLLIGNAGDDQLNGSDGIDTVSYHYDPDAVYVNLEHNQAQDGFGNSDQLHSIENVVGSAFDDEIIGDANTNIIHAGAGDDLVIARDGDDIIFGEAGKDTLFGEQGDDFLVGGTEADILDGGTEADHLQGGDGKDRLFGDAGEDFLNGNAGNDSLTGGTGNDLLTGGGDQDVFVVQLNDGTDTITDFTGVGATSHPSSAVIQELDTLKFSGAGLVAKNMLLTQSGNDLTINFEGIDNTTVILQDFQLENLENLNQKGGRFNRIGNIIFNGQSQVTDSFDVFDANQNSAQVAKKNTVTFLNDLDNVIQGFNNSRDVINGQGGNDTIRGLSGNDLLRGGTGNDTLEGGTGSDRLVGNADHDLLNGGNGHDTLEGGNGNDQLYGEAGKDFLIGGTGNDLLEGGIGNDYLFGGADNDFLIGGSGNDLLEGGIGSDIFVLATEPGYDTIGDFEISADFLGLSGGLTFNDLLISQGTGANSNDTLLTVEDTGDLLATLSGVQANTVTNAHFAVI